MSRGHGEHDADPASALYFPATHSEHVSPSRPVEPALQVQSVSSVLASGAWAFAGHPWHTSAVAPTSVEYCPAAQLLQTASPAAILYFPATHLTHEPPSRPVEPALQVQAVETELPS